VRSVETSELERTQFDQFLKSFNFERSEVHILSSYSVKMYGEVDERLHQRRIYIKYASDSRTLLVI
jgi:hypothetical protein